MSFDLKNRNFLKELDLTKSEFIYLLELSAELKAAKENGSEQQHLAGRNIALIFEKSSTRTRTSFEVAAYEQGANVTYLGPTGSQIGYKESMKDTARMVGSIYDGIGYRGFAQETVDILGEFAGIPVWNGLTDEFHPTQTLADILTMTEHVDKHLEDISYCYVGDARNNMGNSLMITGCLLGVDVRICGPKSLRPEEKLVATARGLAEKSGARFTLTDNVAEAVEGVDYLYTDVWVSMGEPPETWDERIELLKPYQVNAEMIELAGNPDAQFMHCLPAFHDRRTTLGAELYERTGMDALEVTDEVFESDCSIVFQQAANRMPTIKAIMVATLGD